MLSPQPTTLSIYPNPHPKKALNAFFITLMHPSEVRVRPSLGLGLCQQHDAFPVLPTALAHRLPASAVQDTCERSCEHGQLGFPLISRPFLGDSPLCSALSDLPFIPAPRDQQGVAPLIATATNKQCGLIGSLSPTINAGCAATLMNAS